MGLVQLVTVHLVNVMSYKAYSLSGGSLLPSFNYRPWLVLCAAPAISNPEPWQYACTGTLRGLLVSPNKHTSVLKRP